MLLKPYIYEISGHLIQSAVIEKLYSAITPTSECIDSCWNKIDEFGRQQSKLDPRMCKAFEVSIQ